MWVRARAASSKETVSSVPAWFRGDSGTLGSSPGRATFFFLDCDIFNGLIVWLGSSAVRVLARYARDPGFESRSGHVLFPCR